jgi:hypothetical protein
MFRSFDTPAEEAQYWRDTYQLKEAELEEFQATSRELESELERELESKDKQIKDLQTSLQRAVSELGQIKVCVLDPLTSVLILDYRNKASSA